MTAFEDAIYAAVVTDAEMIASLAQVSETGAAPFLPAFFERFAPADNSSMWGNPPRVQYPRIVYEISRTGDWTHTITGTLTFHAICQSNDTGVQPEALSFALQRLFQQAVFHPDTAEPVIFCQFRTAQLFDLAPGSALAALSDIAERSLDLIGVTLTFQLTGFPSQSTVSPSPIDALNAFCLTAFAGAVDVDPAVYHPSDTNPALYWRPTLEAIDFADRGTHVDAVTWYRVTCKGSLLCPDTALRARWAERIARALGRVHEIPCTDPTASPFEFSRVAFDPSADATSGQVTVEGWVGELVPDLTALDDFIDHYTLRLQGIP